MRVAPTTATRGMPRRAIASRARRARLEVVLRGCGWSPAGDRAAPWRGTGAPGRRGCTTRSTRTGSRPRPGCGSSRCCALRDVEPPAAHEQLAVARVARRHHAVEHVDAGADRRPDVLGRADAHQVARAVGRHLGARSRRSRRTSPRAPRRRRGRPARARRTAAPRSRPGARAADRRATPPCTMPKRSWPGAARRGHAAARPARSCAPSPPRSPARGASDGGHSSNAIAMSLPSAAWIAIARSGVSRCSLPSRCERNVTPSSSTVRRSRRLNTWKPPESVRIARGQPMNLCRPPSAAIRSAPGRSAR